MELAGNRGRADRLFPVHPLIFLFLIPAITMRSIAEERKNGTLELLLTHPLDPHCIVWAKFLAGTTLVVAALLPTLAGYACPHAGQPSGQHRWRRRCRDLGLVCSAALWPQAWSLHPKPTAKSSLSCRLHWLAWSCITAPRPRVYDLGKADHIIQWFAMETHYRSIGTGVVVLGDVAWFAAYIALALAVAQKPSTPTRMKALQDSRTRRSGWRGALLAVASWDPGPMAPCIDVTEDRRHSLSDATESLLSELSEGEEEILVRCYLEGDFRHVTGAWLTKSNPSCARLRARATAKSAGNSSMWPLPGTKNHRGHRLALYKGLRFTRIAHREAGVTAFQNIWPCAMVTVRGVDYPVQFLRSENMDPDVMVQMPSTKSNSTWARPCDWACATAVRWWGCCKATGASRQSKRPTSQALAESAEVVDVWLDGAVDALCEKIEGRPNRQPKYDALIVAGPTPHSATRTNCSWTNT